MSNYRAPLAEMHFVLTELAGLDEVASLPGFEEAAPDVVSAILRRRRNSRPKSSIRSTAPATARDRVAWTTAP